MQKNRIWLLVLFSLVHTQLLVASDFDSSVKAQEIAKSINQFGFDLFQSLSANDESITISPTSLSLVLSMLYAGAKGETAQAMQRSLYLGENSTSFHQSVGNFISELNQDRSATETAVAVANDIWLQKGFKVLETFSQSMSLAYNAKVPHLNFKGNPNTSTETINKAISEKTMGEIPQLFKNPLDSETRLVLTNAMYFNGKWQTKFMKDENYESVFIKLNGERAPTTFMNRTMHVAYSESEQAQYLAMPYQDDDFFALFVLPREGFDSRVTANLNHETFAQIVDSLSINRVNVSLPKFTQRMTPEVNQLLQQRGLALLFDRDHADLSGINGVIEGEDKLCVSQVVHEAVVKMFEEGTTAAAASGIILVGITSIMPVIEPAIEFTANRPFSFFMVHRPSKAILFMGRVTEPKAE